MFINYNLKFLVCFALLKTHQLHSDITKDFRRLDGYGDGDQDDNHGRCIYTSPNVVCFDSMCYGYLPYSSNWVSAWTSCARVFANVGAELVSIHTINENLLLSGFLCSRSVYEDVFTSGYQRLFNMSNLSGFKWYIFNDMRTSMDWKAPFEQFNETLNGRSVAITLIRRSKFMTWKVVSTMDSYATVLCKWKNIGRPRHCSSTSIIVNYNCSETITTMEPTDATSTMTETDASTITSDASTITATSDPFTIRSTSTSSTGCQIGLCTTASEVTTIFTDKTTSTYDGWTTMMSSTFPSTIQNEYCPGVEAFGCVWPRTPSGQIALTDCPKSSHGKASWFCDETTLTFYPPTSPNFSKCLHDWIIDILNMTQGNMSTSSLSEIFWNKANKTPQFYSEDIKHLQTLSSVLVQRFVSENRMDESYNIEEGFNFISNMMSVNNLLLDPWQTDAWMGLEENVTTTASQFLSNIEITGFTYASLLNNSKAGVARNHLEIHVEQRPKEYFFNRSYSFDVVNTSLEHWIGASFSLPSGFERVIDGQSVSVVAVLYNRVQFFLTNNFFNKHQMSIMSNVLGLSIGSDGYRQDDVHFDDGLVHFKLPHTEYNQSFKHVCAFWNISRDFSSFPDSSGCKVIEQSSNFTSCSSNHLTNFAILLDINNVIDNLDVSQKRTLECLTMSLGCVSLICLIFSIIIFRSMRMNTAVRIIITKNLCISLFSVNLIMVIGLRWTSNKFVCYWMAVSMHYALLCSFAWMLLEGIHLYRLIIIVFETSCEKLLSRYYAIGYGIPALIVIASIFIWPNEYGTIKYCWLDTHGGVIWAFAGPVLAVILANSIILLLALRTAASLKRQTTRTRLQQFRKSALGSLSLMSILGITWIFGYFYVDLSTIFFAYVFTILNASQGIFILLFQCVFNDNVRNEILDNFRRIVVSRSDASQNSTERIHKIYKNDDVQFRVKPVLVGHDNWKMQNSPTVSFIS